MTDVRAPARGELLVAISNRIVAVYKELYGKGPVKVRTWMLDDVILCVLRGGLTRSEQTLVEIGRGDRVALQRDSFHAVAAPVFSQVVEELTGRTVVTVLDATEGTEDVSALVFLLQPADEAAVHATDEGLRRERRQMRKKAQDVRGQSRALREKQRLLESTIKPPPSSADPEI